MRNIYILIITILASISTAVAQQRSWHEGSLSWNDFSGKPLLTASPTNFSAEIIQRASNTYNKGLQQFSIEAEAVMYPERSYADSLSRTPERLRLYQAQFDLLEVLSRRFQSELSQGMNGIEADRRLKFYNNLYKTEARRMAEETAWGTDEPRLQYFEYDVRRQLEDIGTPAVPEVEPSPFRYGAFIGIGGTFPTREISDHFSGACDFVFGLTGGYRRFRLEGSIAYGTPTIRTPQLTQEKYVGTQPYYANVKNANSLSLGFNGGFAVLDSKHFSIVPYLGGMWTSYSWTSRPVVASSSEIVFDGLQQRMMADDFNLTFGINFEWHFHSVVTNFPIFGSMREEYISSLRLTPFATRAVYTDCDTRFGGWQVGFTLSYSGVARALRIK